MDSKRSHGADEGEARDAPPVVAVAGSPYPMVVFCPDSKRPLIIVDDTDEGAREGERLGGIIGTAFAPIPPPLDFQSGLDRKPDSFGL